MLIITISIFEKIIVAAIYDVTRDFCELKALIFNVSYVKKQNTLLRIVKDIGNSLQNLKGRGGGSEFLLIFHRIVSRSGRQYFFPIPIDIQTEKNSKVLNCFQKSFGL